MTTAGFSATIEQDNLRKKVGPDSRAVKKAKFENFRHAAASIRKTAQASIKRAPKEQRTRQRRAGGKIARRAKHAASPAGSPVFTQRGAVRRAIAYHYDEHGAFIGPRGSIVGDVMAAHEFGENYKGQDYPERAVMGPARDANLERFGRGWKTSIGE